jgi:hypothetical protein
MAGVSLNDYVLEKLRSRPRETTLRHIADATGLHLDWLEMYSQRKIKDPSVNRVETLYVYLTGEELAMKE